VKVSVFVFTYRCHSSCDGIPSLIWFLSCRHDKALHANHVVEHVVCSHSGLNVIRLLTRLYCGNITFMFLSVSALPVLKLGALLFHSSLFSFLFLWAQV
jgi:hypothetical protein